MVNSKSHNTIMSVYNQGPSPGLEPCERYVTSDVPFLYKFLLSSVSHVIILFIIYIYILFSHHSSRTTKLATRSIKWNQTYSFVLWCHIWSGFVDTISFSVPKAGGVESDVVPPRYRVKFWPEPVDRYCFLSQRRTMCCSLPCRNFLFLYMQMRAHLEIY